MINEGGSSTTSEDTLKNPTTELSASEVIPTSQRKTRPKFVRQMSFDLETDAESLPGDVNKTNDEKNKVKEKSASTTSTSSSVLSCRKQPSKQPQDIRSNLKDTNVIEENGGSKNVEGKKMNSLLEYYLFDFYQIHTTTVNKFFYRNFVFRLL